MHRLNSIVAVKSAPPCSVICLLPTLFCLLANNPVHSFSNENFNINVDFVREWANKFGNEIHIGSTRTTCFEQVDNNYNEMGARPAKRDANKILEEMTTDMGNMFQWKTEHVRRIAQRAEELAANYSSSDAQLPFEFYNAKKVYDERDGPPSNLIEQTLPEQHQWKGLTLRRSPLFGRTLVSFEESAVHVPVNVFEGNVGLRTPIKWSGSLKDVFRNNRVIDPDVYWQYFCSASGFMRLYPAAIWRVPDLLQTPDHERKPLDMYDCRMRNWYVRAAASPKDVVVLLDGSGSMSGQRKEIARNVVTHILDTLGDDDHVAVLRFSDHIQPVVTCFGNRLVQANAQNVRRFKQNLTLLNTTDIANFSLALRTAFQLLKNSTSQRIGSNCNQAIMLVTDGAPGNDRLDHRTIFEEFNYPRIDIRVFSYLVGKEVTDTKEVNWMACANRGYYTHVASLAEIREQVQLYLPVMARPLVLARDRVYGFTPVYADVMDVPLTNWVWEAREREKIRQGIRRRIREANEQNRAIAAANDAKQKKAELEAEQEKNEPTGSEDTLTKNNESSSGEPPSASALVAPDAAGFGFEAPDSFDSAVDTSSQLEQLEQADQVQEVKRSIRRPRSSSFADDEYTPEVNGGTDHWQGRDDEGYNINQDKILNEGYGDEDSMRSMTPEPIPPKKKGVTDMMITISAPVFDTKNTTNITEKYLEKNVWRQRFKEIRSANLLGVAGVDVPIKEVVRHAPAYRLGVNGYSFVINNNGHIVYHPDLRPLFQELLKPYFSSVDLTEVELQDNQALPRAKSKFDQLRANMINRVIAWDTIPVKMHIDQMKRVVIRNQSYYTQPIKNTPFSLAIVLPESYGRFYAAGQIEFKRRDENYTKYFVSNRWRVHPDWVYCDDDPSNKLKGQSFQTPEQGVLLFLEKAMQSEKNIRWKSSSLSPQVYEELTCNKELVQSLIFDAKATDLDIEKCQTPNDIGIYDPFELLLVLLPRQSLANKFGVTLTFIATRSGLTRFEDHWIKNSPGAKTGGGHSSGGSIDSPDEGQALPEDSYEPIAPTSAHSIPLPEDPEVDDLDPPEPEQPGNGAEFGEKHNRATDEPFYKRAVDFHLVDESAFVYSVPFGIGRRPDAEAEVTASRAIFVGQGQERAPAAVVGLRMRLQTFGDKFFNSSHRCERGQCANVCQRWSEQSNGIDPNIDSYRCVLIDNNGYVVVDSGSHSSVGRLMIELDAPLFNTLVDAGVYRSVRMFDYQSMCIELLEKPQLVGSGSGTCRAMRHSFVRHSLQSIFWLWIDLAYNWHETLVSAATSVWSQMSSAYQDVTGQDQFAADQSDSSEPPSVRGMAKDSKGKLLPPNRTRPFPCDKQFTLYDLQPSSRSELASRPMRREYVKCDDCQQEFIAASIKHTNLMMIVYKEICPCNPSPVKVIPSRTYYSGECEEQLMHVDRHRKRPEKCNNYNPQEAEILQCGGASSITSNISFILLITIFGCVHIFISSLSSQSTRIIFSV